MLDGEGDVERLVTNPFALGILFRLRATVVFQIRADALNDVALFQPFEAERLAVERIGGNGLQIGRNQRGEGTGQLILVGEPEAFDSQGRFRHAQTGAVICSGSDKFCPVLKKTGECDSFIHACSEHLGIVQIAQG